MAALQDDSRCPRYIETVARRGYRFIAAGRAIADRGTTPAAGATVSRPLQRLATIPIPGSPEAIVERCMARLTPQQRALLEAAECAFQAALCQELASCGACAA